MRRFVLCAPLLALLLTLVEAPAHAEEAPTGPVASLPQVVRGAHRAGALEGPEGTIPGIEAALAAGSDVVDLDVRSLGDGALVVSHDPTTTRLTTSRSQVTSLSIAGWSDLVVDAAAWFGTVAGAAPVTFRQVLKRYAGRVTLLVELKTASSLPRAISVVKQLGAQGSVILQSQDPAVVRQVDDAGLHAGIWRNAAQLAADDPATWLETGAEQMVVQGTAPVELIDKVVASGLPAWICGVNDPAWADQLITDHRVRGILSDAPRYTFRRTTSRRLLPVAHWVSSLRLRRSATGYVEGRVLLPALGATVPAAKVTVTVGGLAYRGRSDAAGRFRVAVKAPATVGTYRVGVSSANLTVAQPGSPVDGWAVKGTARVDDVRPVLTVVR